VSAYGHVQKQVELNGEFVAVDERMVDLIKLCWEKGLETLGCCQGYLIGETLPPGVHDLPQNRWAYVAFSQDTSVKLVSLLGEQRREGSPYKSVMVSGGGFKTMHENELGIVERMLVGYPGWRICFRDRLINGKKNVIVNFPAEDLQQFTDVVGLILDGPLS